MHLARLAAVVVVLFLGFAQPAAAQAAWTAPVYGWGSGWCQGCYLLETIDSPNLSSVWGGTIDGWGFWCSTGELVQRADVYYSRPGAFLKRVASHLEKTHVSRPDVMRYFLSAGCPAVPSDTGWQIVVDEPIPPGAWVMSIVLWHGAVSTTQQGLVVVSDGNAARER
jgi:hypothetical protein